MEVTPTSANWKEYAKIMKEQSAIMRVRAAAHELAHAKTIDECRPVVASLSDALSPQSNARSWNMIDLYMSFLAYQDTESSPAVDYLRYGFPDLDRGMFTEPGDVVIIGGYPSDGKTALSLSFAWEFSKTRKVGYFSLETDLEKIRDRLVTHVTKINFSQIKNRRLSNVDWDTAATFTRAFVENQNLIVFQAAGMSVHDIQSVSRAYGFDVIFVDYIQLVRPDPVSGSTRAEQIAVISRSMHTFAQHSKTTVFELAQLSRPEKGSASKDPNMNDLKESGQLEQDADAILIVFREHAADKQRILKVAKNKEGLIGKWRLNFDGSTQTFSICTDVGRSLNDAGRAAKLRNRQAAYEQTAIPDDYDMPF